MNQIKTDKIVGSRRLSNYWWAAIILLGGCGFFFIGISSYFNVFIDNLIYKSDLSFIPQGAVMTFYGMTGILISLFLWYTIFFDVGSGYNEFNNNTGIVTIFRLGFPGKNRILRLRYQIKEITAIKVQIQDGLSPKREIYLKIKDKREIPITKVGEPISIYDIEKKATEISTFLNVCLEGFDENLSNQ
uniref:Photosystem I assembly protein Ycf4 n=1 Tax=Ophidocladus simpliciusculus TaxID=1261574 RepID=A0A1Z1MJI0_9FLOR|nr:photosystem I assembly protein [Ophidocladus simpliciusculus]ARW65975.1 photosystem I assembly protein [Ophidocladus simpliciusculus]